MSRRSPAVFLDPDGERHGLPTYPWGWVSDPDLATKQQLRAQGLRPAGQAPAAQIMWRSSRAGSVAGVRTALLYRISLAAPVRAMTPARQAAITRALLARMTCRTCGAMFEYCLPTSLGGLCEPCDADEYAAALADLAA